MQISSSAYRLLGIGFYIAACIGGGIYTGWKFGNGSVILLLAGLLGGLIAAGLGVFYFIRPFMKKTGKGE